MPHLESEKIMRFDPRKAVEEADYLKTFCDHLYLENNCEEGYVIKGLPRRMVFETKIWQVGEKLRTELKDSAKRTPILKNGIVAIIKEREYRRGRESFVLLLHFFLQDDDTIPLFEWLLKDSDLYGFAITELNQMGIAGFSETIAGIYAAEKTGWIRREAKSYMVTFSTDG